MFDFHYAVLSSHKGALQPAQFYLSCKDLLDHYIGRGPESDNG
jgi:hypothetical protein